MFTVAEDDQDAYDDDEGYSEENFESDIDDLDALEEVDDEDDDGEDETEDEINESYDVDLDVSVEGIKFPDDRDDFKYSNEDDDTEEYVDIPGVNDIDDNSAEPLEEVYHIKKKST